MIKALHYTPHIMSPFYLYDQIHAPISGLMQGGVRE